MGDDEKIRRIAKAYSTSLALAWADAKDGPFTRAIEQVEIDHGECRRKIVIDWHLPTLAEALPSYPEASDPQLVEDFSKRNPVLVVPIYLIRKGRLMNGFTVESSTGENLYLCGRQEKHERTSLLMRFFWNFVERAPDNNDPVKRALAEQAKERFFALPATGVAEAVKSTKVIEKYLQEAKLLLHPGALDRIIAIGRYVARHHIMWLHLTARPGQAARLTVTYRTRFAAGYPPPVRKRSPRWKAIWTHAVAGLRRFVGQEPFEFRIPLTAHRWCRSYHMTMPAPAGNYFKEQRFVLEHDLSKSKEEQERRFSKFCKKNKVDARGKNEAGGPVAHLYARNLASALGKQIYAYAFVRERPPGTTALVMWLTLFTSAFMWIYWLTWQQLTESSSSQSVNTAALFATLPGLASIWFSRAFKDDIRPRIPLVSRVGIGLVGFSAFYALLGIVVQRGACPGESPCHPVAESLFSHSALLIMAVLLTVLALALIERRWRFHRCYQNLQNDVRYRYMR